MHSALLLLGALLGCLALQQEVLFYDEPGATGDSVRFIRKYENLTPWQMEFINGSQSYCFTGWFRGFSSANFTSPSVYPAGSIILQCYNRTPPLNLGSLRIQGPPDFLEEALSVFSGTTFDNKEIVITRPAADNFGFQPASLLISGYSNWTVFSNNDFSGNETCIRGTQPFYTMQSSTPKFLSVIKGCDLPKAEVQEIIFEYYRQKNLY